MKLYPLIKMILKNNNFAVKNKRLKLEVVNVANQEDKISIQHSLYNSSKLITSSKELQAFLKDAYYDKVASKTFDIPLKINAVINLPNFKIDEITLEDSVKTNNMINDLKTKINNEGVILENKKTKFSANISLTELFENFYVKDYALNELLNNCQKAENNSEIIKKENNFTNNIKHQADHCLCL